MTSSWRAATFLRPAADLLAAADAVRAKNHVMEAGQLAYAALMTSCTRGVGESIDIQYSLPQPDTEKAMRLFTEAMKENQVDFSTFTEWFNLEVLANAAHDGHEGKELGHSLLREAVAGGDVEATRSAIDSGAEVNAKDSGGGYVLEVAAAEGHAECARLLVAAGARVTQGNSHGSTALHAAAYFGHVEVLRFLLDALPADDSPDVLDERGSTPLVAASASGSSASDANRMACVHLLLAAGADASKVYNEGAHASVLPLLGAAAGRRGCFGSAAASRAAEHEEGSAAEQSGAAECEGTKKTAWEEAKAAWEEAFARAIAMGALTQEAVDESAAQLAKTGGAWEVSEKVMAQRMREQLADLARCRAGGGSMLGVDTRVCLRGLQAKPRLNGACGRVKSFVVSKGRYAVALEPEAGAAVGESITVKAANLEKAMIPEHDEMMRGVVTQVEARQRMRQMIEDARPEGLSTASPK